MKYSTASIAWMGAHTQTKSHKSKKQLAALTNLSALSQQRTRLLKITFNELKTRLREWS